MVIWHWEIVRPVFCIKNKAIPPINLAYRSGNSLEISMIFVCRTICTKINRCMEFEITQLRHETARTPTAPPAGPAADGRARKQVGAKKVPGYNKKGAGTALLRKAEKEIKEHPDTEELLIKKAPFGRLVKELTHNSTPQGTAPHRWQVHAVRKLQEEVEYFLSELSAEAQISAHHARRVTITTKELALAIRMRRLDVNG